MKNEKFIPASWAEDDGSAIVYMCRTDWEFEVSGAMGGCLVFPSEEDLKAHLKCWKGCGIVEVKVTFSRLVEEGTEP